MVRTLLDVSCAVIVQPNLQNKAYFSNVQPMLTLDVQVLHLITFKLFIGVLQSFNELKYLIWVYMLFQNLLVLSELTLLAKTKNNNNSNNKKDKLCKIRQCMVVVRARVNCRDLKTVT